MREPGSILGYASLPALLAVLVALPFVSPDASLPPAAAAAGPPDDGAGQEAPPPPSSFRMGRNLLAETTGIPCCATRRPDRLRVLVTLLPDPDQSSLDWNYDASLASIRRALEAAGYTSDRSWFPPGDSLVTVTGEGGSRTLPLPQVEPAVLVFRGGQGASTDTLAVVYVVGEVPTTGVHKGALRTALAEASILEAGDTLRLLGPSFSGSVPSLRTILENPPEGLAGRHVRIVSGSATAARNPGILTGSLVTPLAGVTYGTTVHTDDAYAAALEREVLEPLGLRGSDVVLLTESNTGYGAALSPDDEEAAATAGAGAPGDTLPPHSLARARTVPFPLNIAALRAEYARNPADSARGTFRLPGRTSRIPLSLQLQSRPLEVPPARSRLTAPALDIAMGNVLRALDSHGTRAVGILASDVRDKLFLAGLVRQELPDALLFTFEGHTLFQRPELTRRLRGMVVVSTYPLILENAVWTGNPLLTFPAEPAVGVFNATLLLLDRPGLVYQYRPPGAGSAPEGEGVRPPVWITAVGNGTLQPLAADTVGAGPATDPATPLPAVVHDHAAETAPEEHDHAAGERHAHPVGLLSLVAVATVLSTGFALVLSLLLAAASHLGIGRHDPGRSTDGDETPPAGVGPARTGFRASLPAVLGVMVRDGFRRRRGAGPEDWEDPGHVGWRTLDLLGVAVAVLAFVGPLSYLNGVPAPWEVAHHGLDRWIGVLAVTLLLLYTALLAVWVSRNVARRRVADLEPLVDLEPHVMAVLLGALGLLYCVQLRALRWEGVAGAAGGDASSLAFGLYRYRALHLESATSGMLLFLLASLAVTVAVVWHRNRRWILRRERPPLEDLATMDREAGKEGPPTDHWSRATRDMGRAMLEVRRFLEGRMEVPRALAVGLILVAPVVLGLLLWWPDALVPDDPWLPTPTVRTLDDMALDRGGWAATTRALWAGLALGFGFTVLAAVHLVLVWRPFRSFLHALSSLPVAPALDRIPERLRTLGRLHLFDPPAEKLGQAQAETGHEAVWKAAAARLDTGSFAFMKDVLEDGIPDVSGLDSPAARAASLTSLMRVLRRAWTDRPELALAASAREGGGSDAAELERWVREAELVVAVEVTRYVEWVLRNLRRIALLLLFTIVWTTAWLEAMPFPHHAGMTVIFVVLTVGGVGAVMGIMAHLSQDDVMSRINGTPPGKITWRSSSLLSAMAFVMIPVLGLLGTEIEPVGRVLFGWVSDILRVLSTV